MAKNKKKKKTLAQRADRHELYQESVQDSEFELDFVQDTYKGIRKRKPVTLREDFAGTSRSACVWVKRNKNNQAWAVDFDEEVLEWGRVKNNDTAATSAPTINPRHTPPATKPARITTLCTGAISNSSR